MKSLRKAIGGAVLSIAVLMLSTTIAGEPSRPPRSAQREAVEAILARPVEWTPKHPQSVTIDEFIEHARSKHGLAIRWDAPSLMFLNGDGGFPFSMFGTPGTHRATVWSEAAPSPYVQAYSTAVPAHLQHHVTNFPTATPTYAPADAPTDQSPAAPVPPADASLPAQPAPLPPELSAKAEAVKPAADASDSESDDEPPYRVLSAMPIRASNLALEGATVGETLQQLLEAVLPPINGLGEDVGIPLTTRALTLDFVVDGRSVVITTALRANARKETRVYPIGHLKGLPQEQIAQTICRSIRPWSWRSQTAEIAERLAARMPKGGLTLPQVSMSSTTIMGDVTPASHPASGPAVNIPQPVQIKPEEIAALGQLLSGGAIAAVETIVNAVEIVHYGDPPTGVMQVLPGMLVITQSQGAHREIADLLAQLASSAP